MLKKKKEKRIGTHPCCKSLPTFRRGSPAPLRSVPVMEWTALISFRSLQRSIVLLYKCIHLKIVNTSSFLHYIDATKALKYFYLTAVHKKIAIFFGMFLSEVVISYQKAFLYVLTDENGVSDVFKQTFYLNVSPSDLAELFCDVSRSLSPKREFFVLFKHCSVVPAVTRPSLPTCLLHPSSRHPSGPFLLRLLSAYGGCCFSRLLFSRL